MGIFFKEHFSENTSTVGMKKAGNLKKAGKNAFVHTTRRRGKERTENKNYNI